MNAKIIAEMLDSARKFTLFYLGKVPATHLHHRPVIDGREANSAHFIAGHLLWAETQGLIASTGGTAPEFPWIQQFAIKQAPAAHPEPSMPELLAALELGHKAAMDHVLSLSDEDLQQPCFIPLMNWNTTRQKALYHFIRHESFHTGQLALIARSGGAELP